MRADEEVGEDARALAAVSTVVTESDGGAPGGAFRQVEKGDAEAVDFRIAGRLGGEGQREFRINDRVDDKRAAPRRLVIRDGRTGFIMIPPSGRT